MSNENLPAKKSSEPGGSLTNSIKHLKKESTPTLLNSYKKIEEGTLSNTFYEASKDRQRYHKETTDQYP